MKLVCETVSDGQMVLESTREDLPIQEMAEGFKTILRGMGYTEESINATFKQDEKGVSNDCPPQIRWESFIKVKFGK